jgi:DNA-binding MarR family transcriptional regulator
VGEAQGIDVVVRLSKVLEIVLAELGLTMNQFRLLTLVDQGSPSAAELSLRLVMKPPNVSVLTAGLVERDLVVQQRHADDGRRRTLTLTPTGEALLARAHEECGAALRFLADASPGRGDPLRELEGWLPALDEAAVQLRARADSPPSVP